MVSYQCRKPPNREQRCIEGSLTHSIGTVLHKLTHVLNIVIEEYTTMPQQLLRSDNQKYCVGEHAGEIHTIQSHQRGEPKSIKYYLTVMPYFKCLHTHLYQNVPSVKTDIQAQSNQ
jgi:hypothetical protein